MKCEARNNLRPVTVMTPKGEVFKGFFHGFFSEGSNEDGIGTYAVIEKEDGTVTQADAFRVQFKDIELEPEDVTFYCKECGEEMNAQTDIANEGLCDPCNQGQKEMWAAEQKHEAYEYRNMKI